MSRLITFCAVALTLLGTAGAFGQDKIAPLAFKKAWEYRTGDAMGLPPTVDGGRLFLPLNGGRVVCLDRLTGALLWSSDPGGNIAQAIAAADRVIYVATRWEADPGGSLRALDKETGLTLWRRDYEEHFTGPLHVAEGRLYGGTSGGALCAIATDGGEVVWRTPTQDVVRGQILMLKKAIYFGSDDGSLRGIETDSGREFWRFQTEGRIRGKPATDEATIYFGSGDGYVYAVDSKTARIRWRSRTGAAVDASPMMAGDKLIIASFDNFVYALSRVSGDRVWKIRLDNRITAEPIVDAFYTIAAPLRGDQVAVLSNSDGRRVNRYKLDEGYEIVANPILRDGTLFIMTDKGLVVAGAQRSGPPEVAR